MPTKWTRPLALVVALTAVLSMSPWLIAAEGKSSQLAHAGHATPSPAAEEGANQTPQSLPGEGLKYVHQEGATTIGGGKKKLEAYSFFFDHTAYIPEDLYEEAMVVQVRSGSFALRVGEENLVIADPAGQTIPILEPTDDPVRVPDPNQSKRVVTRLDGDECNQLCALPPGETVLIHQGATVYLPESTTCFWCNVTSRQASLVVFPVRPQETDRPFRWTDLEGIGTPEAEALATPEAEAPDGARHFYHVKLSGLAVGCM